MKLFFSKLLYPNKPYAVTSSHYFKFEFFLSILPHKILVILSALLLSDLEKHLKTRSCHAGKCSLIFFHEDTAQMNQRQ